MIVSIVAFTPRKGLLTVLIFYYYILGCLTNDGSSKPPAIPTSSTSFSPITPVPTPMFQPLPQPNPMALLPGSRPTAQPTRPTQQLMSMSCSADVKKITPAHAQLLSAASLPNLRPTAPTASFQSVCRTMMNNASL